MTLGALCLALATAISTGGCVSAGLAAVGPVLTAVQALVDRSVDRTFPADLGVAEGATVDALSRMGVRLKGVDRTGEVWTVEGKGEAMTLYAKLERVTPRLTRVSVRVENGGLGADKGTADEILNQVAISLAPAPAARSRPSEDQAASAEAVSALRREIERLGSRFEQRESRAAPVPAPATLDTGRILRVPASAGVPSLPAAGGMTLPARAETLEAERAPVPVEQKVTAARVVAEEQTLPADTDGMVLPLSPVGSLPPVETFTSRGSAK
jgi:hypothetical protein